MKLRSISATMPALRRCDTPSLVTPQQLESRSLITADTGRRDCEPKRRHGMPPRAAVYCRSTATGWAPEAHALLEIRCVGRVQRAAVSEALGDARRSHRGPRAYRSHYRLVAALDGAGAGRPDSRDNLGDIPVRGVHGDISSASASATDEEPRRNCGSLVLLRQWAWGVEPNEPAARLAASAGRFWPLALVGMQTIFRGADDHPEAVDVVRPVRPCSAHSRAKRSASGRGMRLDA